MLSNIKIQAATKKEAFMLYVDNWKYLASGQGHFVLENIEPKDILYSKVLRVCKHPLDSLPPQFEDTYEDIISKVPNLSIYLHKRQKIEFEEESKEKFRKMVKEICGTDINKFRAYLADNLNRSEQQWDYMLEFKPKTPLPDLYSRTFLKNFCEKHKIRQEDLLRTLEKGEYKEHLRWFKKNVFKGGSQNLNSLQIFSIGSKQVPNYLSLTKYLHQKNKQGFLTNENIAECLGQSRVFQGILRLQLLHNNQNDFSHIDPFSLWQNQTEKTNQIQQAKANIFHNINTLEDPIGFLSEHYRNLKVVRSQILNKNTFQAILRFLTSWSWRDSSIILRIKMNSQTKSIQKTDLKIIDYELKDATKLTETIKKDAKFLENYMRFKQLI